MSQRSPDFQNDELPDPHASFTLIRVLTEAILEALPAKKADKIVRVMAQKLADEENMAAVFLLRPAEQRQATARAHRQAAEVFRRWAPIFLARVGSKRGT